MPQELERDGLRRLFPEIFDEFSDMEVNSICLLILQMHEDENWEIYREFKRESYPKSLGI